LLARTRKLSAFILLYLDMSGLNLMGLIPSWAVEIVWQQWCPYVPSRTSTTLWTQICYRVYTLVVVDYQSSSQICKNEFCWRNIINWYYIIYFRLLQ
jgi:hypothetical protein